MSLSRLATSSSSSARTWTFLIIGSLSDTHREQDRLVPQQLVRNREPHSGRWRSASCTREAPACQGPRGRTLRAAAPNGRWSRGRKRWANRTRQLRGGRFPRERGLGQVEFQKAEKNSYRGEHSKQLKETRAGIQAAVKNVLSLLLKELWQKGTGVPFLHPRERYLPMLNFPV